MHTQRRYATCPQDMSKKKREEKKYIAHVQEKYKKRDRSCKGVHPLSTKNIPHTCTSWSDCMTRFYLDLVFDLTIWAKQTCLFTPTLSSTKAWLDSRRKEGNNFALVRIWNKKSDSREQFEEQDYFLFQNIKSKFLSRKS